MAEKQQKTAAGKANVPFYLLTAGCVIVLCAALLFAAAIVPYEKVRTYLNIAFMDTMKITPSTGLDGLVIKENDQISTEKPAENAEVSGEGEILRPKFGEQYAVLQCESAAINVPVYWGSSAELLDRGACQSTSSVVLGETGNVVIDAHVNTFFANLNQIKEGDEIVLFTEYGVFTYTASELVTFESTNKKYVLPTDEDRLTLYTCQAQVLGTSATRIGVLCELKEKQFYQTSGEGAAE